MRIKSITVRNYKIHHRTTIELDAACTLIGGPNECGKSTLAEAVHRAFFLKAKITGEVQKAMVSSVPDGQPEVEVCFEAGNKTYRIFKRFSGQTGMGRLSEEGGANWQDEEAEERLAQILRVELVGGGRGAGERVAQQWAHLWVWQGQAGVDPAMHANAQRDSLMSRLQHAGGAALMQSELDAKVARDLGARFETIFNRNGSAKANSDLGRAIEKEQDAGAAAVKAREIFNRLQQAITDHEQAEAAIIGADQSLKLLVPQKAAVEEKLKQVEKLRSAEQLQSTKVETESQKYISLADADRQIRELRSEIAKRRQEVEPKKDKVTKLSEVAEASRKAAAKYAAEYEATSETTRAVRLKRDLAAAYEVLHEKTGQHRILAEKADRVKQERIARLGLEKELAKLPALDNAKFKKLQRLETECSNAESALNAMAARVELISSDTQVQIDKVILAVGTDHLISEDTELTIGGTTRLRVKPGGGAGLTEARERSKQAKLKFNAELDKWGLPSLEAAAEALANRESLQNQLNVSDAKLSELGADSVDQETASAQSAVDLAQGEVDRRSEQIKNFAPPKDLADAKDRVEKLEMDVREQETNEQKLKAVLGDAIRVAEEAGTEAQTANTEFEKENRKITELGIELSVLTRTHGEDAPRAQELAQLLELKGHAERLLAETRSAIETLQPSLLDADRNRLERAVSKATSDRNEADRKLAVARHALSSDGTADPTVSLATAESQLRSAREGLKKEQIHAEAIQLLHDLFQDEQQKLSEQMTRPLADKVAGYLQCLFGAGTRAMISLEESQFLGFQVARLGHEIAACQFDQLSGGTREQVAAAFRLAMAEILAEDHDGCLPVVFDDAFAYSDSERVQTLQRMLDLAASRGLQIIVLTCNPIDYAALGARQITLPPITSSQ